MNFKRILCPIDFSECNDAVNEYASMIAAATGAELVYLHAFLPDVPIGSPALFDPDRDEQRIMKKLKQISPIREGIECSYVVKFGTPTDQIVDYAAEHDVDLIILGTHGRSGVKRVLMGSVAEAVVRRAECPVLAVKADTRVTDVS